MALQCEGGCGATPPNQAVTARGLRQRQPAMPLSA